VTLDDAVRDNKIDSFLDETYRQSRVPTIFCVDSTRDGPTQSIEAFNEATVRFAK
jgi:hypothetical protein